jgi:pimeloyl-ACP methyl ester carboxylesterase
VSIDSEHFGRVQVRYIDHGQGPPLLLVHGLMTTSYSWRYLLEPLGRHFRLLVPDLVGCGESDKPTCHYGPRRVAAFIGDFQRALGVRGCDVVGNSMGGYLCMWLGLDDPTSMKRLINIHSPGVPMARLHALRAALSLPGSRRLLSLLIKRDPCRWAHRNVHYYDESLKSLEEARHYALDSDEGRAAFAHYLYETMSPADMAQFTRRLQAEPFPLPLCLMYARRDPMVPPEVGDKLHALVPEAELHWLDECSHFAHVDRPDLMVERIVGYLTRPS